MIRIGHGYDIHAIDFRTKQPEGNIIFLGGIEIPYNHKIIAHSDGDVAIHAICDALLGAAGLGDIGRHFPDTDPAYNNKDSKFFLAKISQMLRDQNYFINNIDVSIIAEEPKLAPYISTMTEKLAGVLDISINQINVKATTHEKLDAVGNKQAIAVHAVCIITA